MILYSVGQMCFCFFFSLITVFLYYERRDKMFFYSYALVFWIAFPTAIITLKYTDVSPLIQMLLQALSCSTHDKVLISRKLFTFTADANMKCILVFIWLFFSNLITPISQKSWILNDSINVILKRRNSKITKDELGQ